jgi:hypothetical protein
MSAVATGKYCCKCGSDVTNAKRMKDSSGKYWCFSCGSKDQQKQAASVGLVCSVCGDIVPTSQTTKLGGSNYCSRCSKAQKKAGGGLSALLDVRQYFGGGGHAARTKKSIITLVVLVVLIIGVNYLMHRS